MPVVETVASMVMFTTTLAMTITEFNSTRQDEYVVGVAVQHIKVSAGRQPDWLDLVGQLVQLSIPEQLLYRNVQWFRGGLVFMVHRLLYHTTLGSRVINKKKNLVGAVCLGVVVGGAAVRAPHRVLQSRPTSGFLA